MDPTPKRSNASRSRYDEDPGVDRFYTGAHEHNTIATGVKTTMKTYHSALKSKVPQTLPFDTGFTPGPIYQPKTALLSGRRHGLLTDGTRTIPLGPIAVREPDKISPEFYKSYERFQTYAHPNKRPTKITTTDFFALSHRDGNTYRFGSTYR